jgi:hypothetical protein
MISTGHTKATVPPTMQEPVTLRCRDTKLWLEEEFGTADDNGHFQLWADLNGRTSSPDAEPYVERPHQGSTWDGLQRLHGVAPIAAVQGFADKTLVNHKGGYAYPLRLALLNVDREV